LDGTDVRMVRTNGTSNTRNTNMKPTLFLLFALTSLSKVTMAVQYEVKDISGRIVTCTGPLLASFRPGTCIGIPQGTLEITATLEDGEDTSAIEELNYTIRYNNDHYRFNSEANTPYQARWQRIDGMEMMPRFASQVAPSTIRRAFEGRSIVRMIPLGDFYKKEGAQLLIQATRSTARQSKSADPQIVYIVK
jgi:hypothetical protein